MITIITIMIILNKIDFLKILETNKELRKVFGKRELVIMRKQLLGVPLKPSEKTRLSRDIKKKLKVIKILAPFISEFDLKYSVVVKNKIKQAVEAIKEDHRFHRIKKILLFGSTIKNKRTFRSDIDIAVEFDKIDLKEATKFRISCMVPEKVDIQVINVLPEKIKKSIEENHKILYIKNE